jgi:hypothetical protein
MYLPGSDGWHPHASYHSDGKNHWKSYAHGAKSRRSKAMPRQLQRLDQFRGAEHIGYFSCTGSALCYPSAFTAVLRVPPGFLERARGAVIVDLVEAGRSPPSHVGEVPGLNIVLAQTFKECTPWTVITIAELTGP